MRTLRKIASRAKPAGARIVRGFDFYLDSAADPGGDGLSAATALNTVAALITSDFNDFNGASAGIIYAGTTYGTFAAYKAASGQDANSTA